MCSFPFDLFVFKNNNSSDVVETKRAKVDLDVFVHV